MNDPVLDTSLTAAKDKRFALRGFLEGFTLQEHASPFRQPSRGRTRVEPIEIDGREYPRFVNEFWTSKQRQASSLHEIAYRACFKAELPRFFVGLLTEEGDLVYDPFSGRGTTVIEAAILGRNIVANDVNPLSKILSSPRLAIPKLDELAKRLEGIAIDEKAKADIDLSMFYHPKTEAEIVSLKSYLRQKQEENKEDDLDSWIRMVATNRLTGHSPGFFSVYTLPPNQAASPESQKKINEKRRQRPDYRDTKNLILRKSKSLLRGVSDPLRRRLSEISRRSVFLTGDARYTDEIADESVQLTVTSPPFLDVVQYDRDNWLRCWFNGIAPDEVAQKITMPKRIEDWSNVMKDVFKELYRVTRHDGWVAFEVGEVRGGSMKLDEHIVPLGINAGFACEGILVNQQRFTKTSNIWGIRNNDKGTNSNRIVIFHKAKDL